MDRVSGARACAARVRRRGRRREGWNAAPGASLRRAYLRREKVWEEPLDEGEDEHVAEGRERDNEDDDEGDDGEHVLQDATQQLHLFDRHKRARRACGCCRMGGRGWEKGWKAGGRGRREGEEPSGRRRGKEPRGERAQNSLRAATGTETWRGESGMLERLSCSAKKQEPRRIVEGG
eukprot:6193145-Pleurochrysis_carterae.AAC.2